MPNPFEIANKLTEDYADLSPIKATTYGIEGRDDRWDDFSPEGEQAKQDLWKSAIADLSAHLDHPDPVEQFAAKVITGYTETKARRHEQGHWRRDLNHSYSPFQIARDTFDLIDTDGPKSWANITKRLATYGEPLEGYRQSLSVGLDAGDVVAARQVEAVAEQLDAAAGSDSRFDDLVAEAGSKGGDPEAVADAVELAKGACAELAEWLRVEYLPDAREDDAVGREEYMSGVDHFLGMDIDLDETYAWGWEEVHRLRGEMAVNAREIQPDTSVVEVMVALDSDPERSARADQEFVDFVQGIQDVAVQQLDGVHFDVPDEIRTVTVHLAPPGGSLGAWYHGPSEDFSRPGSIWYALGERERIPFWQEVTTAYHEGFPGHHLQVGLSEMQREKLSRFHRQFIWYSGSGEGWALYAERLMDELGYFENPEYRLGLLSSQLFRSVRIVVDIGSQLGLALPADAPLYAGEEWTYDKAVDYIEKIAINPRDQSESEVKRYLGWVAQAISYKVGEREILDIRRDAMRQEGSEFDRKAFHHRVLNAGAIRLDHLREAVL